MHGQNIRNKFNTNYEMKWRQKLHEFVEKSKWNEPKIQIRVEKWRSDHVILLVNKQIISVRVVLVLGVLCIIFIFILYLQRRRNTKGEKI